jgi:hypothetical protein
MGFLAERRAVGIGRIERVLAAVVGIGPLGRVGFADGIVEGVVRVPFFSVVVAFVAHGLSSLRGLQNIGCPGVPSLKPSRHATRASRR